MSGPRAAGVSDAEETGYPGERLGLPADGPGAAAGVGRRLGAVVVDWLACQAIVRGMLGHGAWGPDDTLSTSAALGVPALFALEYLLLLPTTGFTLGMRLFGVRVARLGGGVAGVGAVALRTLLLLLVVPAVVYDRDRRGLHDRAAGTVALRR
jgi:uncharacterized RDD family membrane protein YckC